MNMNSVISALALFASTVAPVAIFPLVAQAQATAEKIEMVAAEVKKVDKDAGKVTLKHGEIKSLDMPAMTMVFKVSDEKLWAKLSEGAKVKVVVEKALVGFNVTHVEPAQ